MKTIAVLTDFSKRSEHAARYALHLAQKIKANVLLFNAFLVPADTRDTEQIAWPVEDYDDIKTKSRNRLIALAGKLKTELKGKSLQGTFLPALSFQCEEGAVANTIPELEENKDIVLIVLATHGTDDLSAFMMGNNCRQIIDTATVPLLIVPENAALRDIEKFAFATDIIHNDTEYINSLATLAKQFSAEIMVVNVSQNMPLNGEYKSVTNSFKDEIVHKINYNRVYYHNVPNKDVKKGLDWLIETEVFDVLVMVHRKSNFYDSFFKPSVTKKVADHVYIPLLVYPYPVTSVPLF